MQRVDWPEYSISTSRLAFGCAPVMGRIGRRDSLKAMNLAHSLGVTHFDVARSYGYGEAESVVGDFLKGKRPAVTVATKFGISPSRSLRLLAPLKPLARALRNRSGRIQTILRKGANTTLNRGNYAIDLARRSFEESLRKLATDYVDVLFLHDVTPDDDLSDELFRYLESCVQSGKCRAWGYATSYTAIETLWKSGYPQPHVVQLAFDCASATQTEKWSCRRLFHSPFGGGGKNSLLAKLLASDRIRQFCIDSNIEFSTKQLSRLLMALAMQASQKDDILLCSMYAESHIRSNAMSFEQQDSSTDLQLFDSLVREHSRSREGSIAPQSIGGG